MKPMPMSSTFRCTRLRSNLLESESECQTTVRQCASIVTQHMIEGRNTVKIQNSARDPKVQASRSNLFFLFHNAQPAALPSVSTPMIPSQRQETLSPCSQQLIK